MKKEHTLPILALALATLAQLFFTTSLHAHGSVGDPISRVYRIFLENPQTPQRPVSQAAIAVSGTQPFYSQLFPSLHHPRGLDA